MKAELYGMVTPDKPSSDEWPTMPDETAPPKRPPSELERGEEDHAARVSLTRARTQHVERIIATMRRGEWQRGVSGPLYATEHGLTRDAVRSYASEAWRAVCREVTDPRKVTEAISATLSSTIQRASQKGDFAGVARVADVWSRVTGARAPERHEVAMVVADYERMTREGKLTWLRERVAVLNDAIAALESSPIEVEVSE